MTETWFIGDLHLGHSNIIKFTDNNGNRIRPFSSIEEHDEALIKNYNDLVDDKDRVYFLGDVAIGRKHLSMLSRFKGRKKLIKGNHDIFKLQDYTPYFDDIVAYRVYPDLGLICSHIPVHTCQLEHRFKYNVHGHLHSNAVKHLGTKDRRYINLCPEHTDFKPVNLNTVMKNIKDNVW